jgi:ABC-type transport system involved in multi-copper enzyme maturation permease subunit
MVLAEIRKVFTRGSGIAALVIALLVGLGAVGGYAWIHSGGDDGMSVNGTPISQVFPASGLTVAGSALWARNFFVLPLFLLLASASTVGGELADRTLREIVVRPVPRWSVLVSKLIALSTLAGATLVVTLLPSLGLGIARFGLTLEAPPPDAATIADLLGAYGASFLSDIVLAALAMAVSLIVPSVGGAVVAVALLLMADKAVYYLLKALAFFGLKEAENLLPWTLNNAMDAWKGWEADWNPAQFGALAIFLTVFLGFSIARFRRMDVP